MKKVIVFASIMMMLLCLAPQVGAYNENSIKMLWFFEESEYENGYEIGDYVNFTIYVFDKGELRDADTPPHVIINEFRDNSRNITVEQIGTGTYTASFIILEEDVIDERISSDPYKWFGINAEATIGKENESDTEYDKDDLGKTITIGGGLDVEINFDGFDPEHYFLEASPGQTVDLTVTVKDKGIPIIPDDFSLFVDDYNNDEEIPISYTNPSVGVYKASYTISSTTSEAQWITLKARADYKDQIEQGSVILSVNFYSIWYHSKNVLDTSATFDIYVADLEGKSIEGANVRFSYESGSVNKIASKDTDSEGKAEFSIQYEKSTGVSMEGVVTYEGRMQDFRHSIIISIPNQGSKTAPVIEEPDTEDRFQIIYQENLDVIQPGSTVTLEYIAYEKAIELSDQILYYYIHTDDEFIESGSKTTDDNGKFSISFNTPSDTDWVYISFESPLEDTDGWYADSDDGLEYRRDQDSILLKYQGDDNSWMRKDKSINIEATPLKIGGKTTITISKQDSEGLSGYVTIAPGEYSLFDITTLEDLPKWQPMSSYASQRFYMPEDGEIIAYVLLPEFLPNDQTYTVTVGMSNFESGGMDYYWNSVTVKPGEKATTEDGDNNDNPLMAPVFSPMGFDIPCFVFLILLVVILIVVFVVAKRRKGRGTTQPYGLPMENPHQPQVGGYNEQNQYPPGPGSY